MKEVFWLLVLLVLTFTMAACTNKAAKSKPVVYDTMTHHTPVLWHRVGWLEFGDRKEIYFSKGDSVRRITRQQRDTVWITIEDTKWIE